MSGLQEGPIDFAKLGHVLVEIPKLTDLLVLRTQQLSAIQICLSRSTFDCFAIGLCFRSFTLQLEALVLGLTDNLMAALEASGCLGAHGAFHFTAGTSSSRAISRQARVLDRYAQMVRNLLSGSAENNPQVTL